MSVWLDLRLPRYLVKYYFCCVYLWVFPKERVFELVDWIRQTALTSVDGYNIVYWGPKSKSVKDGQITLSFLARNIILLSASELLDLRLLASYDPTFSGLQNQWVHINGIHGSLACSLCPMGLLGLHNHVTIPMITLVLSLLC